MEKQNGSAVNSIVVTLYGDPVPLNTSDKINSKERVFYVVFLKVFFCTDSGVKKKHLLLNEHV